MALTGEGIIVVQEIFPLPSVQDVGMYVMFPGNIQHLPLLLEKRPHDFPLKISWKFSPYLLDAHLIPL